VAVDLPTLLAYAKDQGASDLHVSAGMPPMLRLRGHLVRLEMPALTSEDACAAIYDILSDEQRRVFEGRRDLDFALDIPNVSRFRANILDQGRGLAAVFRVIPTKIKTLDELGMPKVLKELASRERGLIVVTGPTGSGKSTTLAAMIDYINETRRGHILTIEDPVEFVHTSKNCLVNQREVGRHTESFAAALRAALREDPDVILVGELRDLETTSLAISAAETGHVVFGTLHTNSAAKTIDRIIDIFPSGQQSQVRTMLSESLEGVVAQTLLPTKDGQGRVAALEVLIGVPALRNLIREDKTAQILSVIQTGANLGMQSLDQSLRELFMAGKLSREEVMRRSTNPRLFEPSGPGSGAEIDPAAPRPAARPTVAAQPGASATAVPPAKKAGLFG
jgi:twitching motility protein PilT